MHKRAAYFGMFTIVLLAGCSAGQGSNLPPAPAEQVIPQTQLPDPPANASVAPSTPSMTTLSTTVPMRLLTADYLGSPWGTTLVSAATAARYLNWAQVAYTDVSKVRAAGIKVMTYFNPNRIQTIDPLYTLIPSTGYAKTCTGVRVYTTFAGHQQFVSAPSTSAMQLTYASYVKKRLLYGIPDAIYEDNAGAISAYGMQTFSGTPCSYSDSAWISGENALEAALTIPTIFNGLSGLNGHNVSLSTALLTNVKSIGGSYEHCYTESANPEMGSWPWVAMENTELIAAQKQKLFFCIERNLYAASTQYIARQYALASFELTYNPGSSVMWSEFATPSGLHVLPESQFVALNPLISTPSTVASLASNNTYKREYRTCYYAGRLIGACAMIVNPTYYTYPRPALSQVYHHTLNLHGNALIDGGTVTFDGSAAPTSLPSRRGYVLVP